MSNIIKPSQYVPLEDIKKLEALKFVQPEPQPDMTINETGGLTKLEAEQKALKDQMMKDAEAYAEEQVRLASEEAAFMKQQARDEMDQWWQERRLSDEAHMAKAREEGYRDGYESGLQEAENAVKEQFQEILAQASDILTQAYQIKQQLIFEAEPFLVELSTAIAGKIIEKQLTLSPEWTIDLIKKTLARRRELGLITLCVSPARFNYVQDFREELVQFIDSQAELQILPDATVQDSGCVVRTAFGSMDARIDTQLTEIKQALLQIAKGGEDAEYGSE